MGRYDHVDIDATYHKQAFAGIERQRPRIRGSLEPPLFPLVPWLQFVAMVRRGAYIEAVTLGRAGERGMRELETEISFCGTFKC